MGTTGSDITWEDVSTASGAFSAEGLDGKFYGPNHEEAGVFFDTPTMVGAFSLGRN